MQPEEYIRIPLRRRDGTIRAHAIIDACDAHQAVHSWSLGSDGYAIRTLWLSGRERRTVQLHREVVGLAPGDGLQADHIDRDRLNCRRSNLRIATNAQNSQNRPSHAGSSSRYRGVTWDRQYAKWKAHSQLNGVYHNLGRFDDEQEAAAVARSWRAAHMPFANEDRTAA